MGVSVVRRFHQALVQVIEQTRPEYLSGAFTVAEIYQALVPYRSHRNEIGVELNGDYEDALLRLLSGEEALVILESEAAQLRIQDELKRADPNTGIYREFAALGVRLNPERLGAVLGTVLPAPSLDLLADVGPAVEPVTTSRTVPTSGPQSPLKPTPLDGSAPAPKVAPVSAISATPPATQLVDVPAAQPIAAHAVQPAAPPASAPSQSLASAPSAAATGDEAPHACPDCSEVLPHRAGLRFCSFCGTDVHQKSCGGCGEALERAWHFCFACGEPQAAH